MGKSRHSRVSDAVHSRQQTTLGAGQTRHWTIVDADLGDVGRGYDAVLNRSPEYCTNRAVVPRGTAWDRPKRST